MQVLIYKTDLHVERAPAWLAPMERVQLVLEPTGSIGAYVDRPTGWFGLFVVPAVRIGALRDDVKDLLISILETGVSLRVRIVELIPAHLSPCGCAQVSVSIWGRPLPSPKVTRRPGLSGRSWLRKSEHPG